MPLISNILIAFVAIEHIGFLILEMFLWTTPVGMEVFKLTPELAQSSQVLAANQGLYNGFLAAGLIWGLIEKQNGFAIKIFFLSCVVVAGVFGALTADFGILLVQAVPAAAALVVLALHRKSLSNL